jgi:DNA-binding MarR family transcriptional regulator
MSDLAGSLGLAESTTTRLVDRLETAGLVRRGTSPSDRRCVVAGLTSEGRRVAEHVRRERREFLTEILKALPQKERAELVELFGLVAEGLREQEEPGP